MFWQNSGNAQISAVSNVKTAIILIEFLIDQNKLIGQFLTINRLINRYFSQPYAAVKLECLRWEHSARTGVTASCRRQTGCCRII